MQQLCGLIIDLLSEIDVMTFILALLLNAAILFALASFMSAVTIKDYPTAILVVLVVAVLNTTIGIFLRFPLNVVTLGLISFFVRLLITAVMIKIADQLFSGFKVKGFTPALIIALVMAIAGTFI